jgi:lipid-binding SYLF domain-containing protein
MPSGDRALDLPVDESRCALSSCHSAATRQPDDRNINMRFPKARCLARLAVATLLSAAVSLPAHAETGTVRFKFFKAGWFIGAQAGSGILSFRGEMYPFRIGGVSAGLTFGGSSTDLVGTARNMRQASDIEGIYTALGAGVAVGAGARALQMRNAKGVILTLEGKQLGLQLDFDLSGMSVSIQRQ